MLEALEQKTSLSRRSFLLWNSVMNGLRSLMQLAIPTLVIVGSRLYHLREVALGASFFSYLSLYLCNLLTTLMTNTLVVLFSSIKIDRMNEIYGMKTQEGRSTFEPSSFNIVFDNVSFAYEYGEKVLDNVSFTAKQGRRELPSLGQAEGKSTCARVKPQSFGTLRVGVSHWAK